MKSLILITATALTAVAHADSGHVHTRPDAHAPISIMADHPHDKGEWMFSYRFMFMDMDGMYDGSDDISSAQVFTQNYIVAPEKMSMEMHMIGAMYAPTDRLTLSAMIPYTVREMDHRIAPGAAPLIGFNNGSETFTTRSAGIGDLKLTGLLRLIDEGSRNLHAGLGLSLPTASIGEDDFLPVPGGIFKRQLPASMQPGSGTFDLLPSLTHTWFGDSWSAGVQAAGIVRLGENHHGYSLGDSFEVTTWAAYKVSDCLSLAAGLAYRWDDELDGIQSDLLFNPPFAPTKRTVPTAFSENYGGQRIEAIAGVNYVIPSGWLENHRLAADIRVPLYEDRNGLSLGTDYALTLGWQHAF